jgi:uracil-DNA glycosylase
MRLGLVQLFEAIIGKTEDALASDTLPLGIDCSEACNENQGELFGELDNTNEHFSNINETDIAIVMGMHAETGIDFTVLKPELLGFFEISRDAFGAVVYAWMSELPVTGQIIRFGRKIIAAANTVTGNNRPVQREKIETMQRKAAKIAATDRGDFDVQTVREAAYKVWHEIHRIMGLLRFCPDEKGVYTAQCEPEHFVLPALGPHFMARFGETPWAIIDHRRRFSLSCEPGQPGASGKALIFSTNTENQFTFKKGQGGEWENLWKHYHKTINNESRNNPDLQKRFMPTRYWKYLSEL